MVFLFTAINLLNYLDRYLVAAVLPLLIQEFSLTNEEAGRLQSAFVIGYVIFSPFFGYLGDRMSRPYLMTFGVVVWSLATVCTGLSTGFSLFIFARIMVGMGEASFGTAAPGYLKDKFQDPVKVNSVLAIFYSAIPVGSALGYVIGGAVSARYDWRTAFYVGGIPGLVLAFSLLFFKEMPRISKPNPNVMVGVKSLLRIPTLMFAIGGYTLNAFALNGVAAFVVPYGMTLGFQQAEINHYFGIILVATGFLGTLGGGRIASKLSARSRDPVGTMLLMIGVLGIVATPLLGLCFLVSDQSTFLLFCFLAELCIFAGVAPVNSILVLSCPPAYVTLTQGVSILCLNLFGALTAPILVGAVADQHSLAIGLQLCTIALLLSGAVWLWGGLVRRREVAV